MQPYHSHHAHDYERKSLDLYLQEIGSIPLISKSEEQGLTRQARQGNERAKKRLIEGNLRFVVSIAKKFCNQRLSLLDLINEGNLGLIEAIKHFDPDRGVRFVTYAVWWIRQSIMQAISMNGFIVKLPLKRSNLRQRVKRKEQDLQQKFGRRPRLSELADSLDENEANIESVLRASRICISLEVITFEEEKQTFKFLSQLCDEKDIQDKVLSSIMVEEIQRLMKKLSQREAEVIHLHYGLKRDEGRLTLEEIGKRFGITKEGVRQIEKKAMMKLKMKSEYSAVPH